MIEGDLDFDIDSSEPDATAPQERDEAAGTDGALMEHHTDLGNAHRFALQHGDGLRYCEPLGGWHDYHNGRWRRDETGEVYRRAEMTTRSIYQEAAVAGSKSERERTGEWAKKSESRQRMEAMIALARYQRPIAASARDFDNDPLLFNVQNGTLDLRTYELRRHRKEDLITKISPAVYDPTAEAPLFLGMLDKIFAGISDLIGFIQRLVGYILTGLTSEQILLMLYGVGANGKSTFIEIIRALLGDYAQTAAFETFLARERGGARNDLARLAGARFVSAVEMASGGTLDEAAVKQLTGGDTISARFLFREHFEFRPEFKLFLVANHRPRIRGTDHAIWRRVRLIPFDVIIPEAERDPLLQERIIKNELAGILNWALDGCRQWRNGGLMAPEIVTIATEEYRQDQDTMAPFLDDCCVVEEGLSVSAKALFDSYRSWAEQNGERPLSSKSFGERLRERGFRPSRTKTQRIWCGLRMTGDT